MMEFTDIQNPFPGLRPFELEESNLFFGREGQSDELLARLQRKRFLAVVGTSGSGKSSLVRAGLLPALHGGLMGGAGSSWRIAILRPGHDPIGNLAGALREQKLVPKSMSKDLPAVDMILDHDGEALNLETKASPRPEELPMELEASEIGVIAATNPDALFQHAIIETTLRRSTVGLVDVVRQARMSAHENLLIVVDQFEELFRFKEARKETGSEDDAAAFVKLLIEASAQSEVPIYVVLTMRSDFLGDCSQFTGLPEAINQGQYLIPRMSRDERRAAITGPVAVGGGEITLPLVSRLLNDVGDNPDQLPILQHALMRTWDYCSAHRRNGEAIGIEHYEAIGTMSEALSRHADEAFDELPDERSRVIAEKLFKRLTEKGADNRETRRPTRLAEICAVTDATDDEVIAVIDVFRNKGRSFLMPPVEVHPDGETVKLTGEKVIDISHESLIRNWVRLQRWVDEEAQSARTYRRLAEDALLHREKRAGLLDDPGLQLTLDWRDTQNPTSAWAAPYHYPAEVEAAFPNAASQDERNLTLFDLAMSYLNASRDARDAAVAERERQRNAELESERRERLQAERYAAEAKRFAAEQAKSARRLRWLAAGMAVMFLVALGGAVLAIKAGAKAERARRETVESFKQLEMTQSALKQKTVLAEEKTKLAEANEIAAKEASRQARIEAERAKEAKLAGDRARMGEQQALKTALVEKKRADERAKQAEVALDAQKAAEAAAAYTAGIDTLNKDALEALQRYEFNKASEMFLFLAKQGKKDLDPVSEGRAKSNLAAVYLKQGRYSEAEKEYEEALVQLHSKLGGGRPLAATMIGLAQVYRESRKYAAAEKQYSELLGAAILDSPKDVSDYRRLVAEVAASRGDLYREEGKFGEALNSYDKAVETWMEVKSDSVGLADRFRGIAQFYVTQERYEQAEKLYLRAYAIWSKYLAEGNLSFARDIEEVASMYRVRNKYAEAEKYYLEARSAWEKQALPGTELSRKYYNLAQFYRAWAETEPGVKSAASDYDQLSKETLGRALATLAPEGVKALLPESGVGYVTNNRGDKGEFQYGQPETIRAIIQLGIEWERLHPSMPFSVGHISKNGGGPILGNLTHRNGLEIDIRPMRTDGLNQPVTTTDPDYSYSLTKELVLQIKRICPDALILFNDPILVKEELTTMRSGQNSLFVRLPATACRMKAK
jgi:tetratricopeptide (TPR) repeat protein